MHTHKPICILNDPIQTLAQPTTTTTETKKKKYKRRATEIQKKDRMKRRFWAKDNVCAGHRTADVTILNYLYKLKGKKKIRFGLLCFPFPTIRYSRFARHKPNVYSSPHILLYIPLL